MSTKITSAHRTPATSVDIDTQYQRELRNEAFSQEPMQSLVVAILLKMPRSVLFDDDEFPLVADHYNWLRIRDVLEHIVSACGEIPTFSVSQLLVQAWELADIYLSEFSVFHEEIVNEQCPSLALFDVILTKDVIPVDDESLKSASDLRDNYFLSLDTGSIMMSHHPQGFVFGHLISKSKAKLRAAVSTMQQAYWDNIDLDGIVSEIRCNSGSRYYNVTTDSWINSPTVKRMSNANEKYKVVANKIDKALFNHIITLLENSDSLSPPTLSFQENHSSPKSRSSPQQKKSNSTRRSSSDDELTHRNRVVSSSGSDSDFNDFTESDSDDDFSPTLSLRRAKTEPIKEKKAEPPKKRKTIPAKVRQLTWRKYIGSSMDGLCWCCADEIGFEKWHAGHVIPASKGGPDSVINLRPLCAQCNLSMSDMHMAEFIRTYGMQGKGAEEFRSPVNADDSDVENILNMMTSLTVQ